MTKKKFWTCVIWITFICISLPSLLQAQPEPDSATQKKSWAFAQVFMGFRHGLKSTYKPQSSFDFNQGIIGYFHQVTPKVSGKIMYDVTRTTNFDWIVDTAGNRLKYSYFEGSKYTAYLKMAEIKWNMNDHFTFRAGQLLNTQYLTFIDKFWDLRYIDVTLQEKFRFGMPADFGIQLDYNYKKRFLNQFSVVNGEGPFRYQDVNGKFIFSNNIQWYPLKNLVIKIYGDYGPAPDTGMNLDARSAFSGFVGYQEKKFRVGAEYDMVVNDGFNKNKDYTGLSVFACYALNNKISFLGRYDHVIMNLPEDNYEVNYYIAGIQYEPEGKFTTAINFRYYSVDYLPFIYINFGLKF